MSSLLPVFLDLADKPILVIGGLASAREKLIKLIPTGAKITVVARRIDEETKSLLQDAAIVHHERAWLAADFTGVKFIISAVDDPAEHAEIAAMARAAGILLNAVDAPGFTDCYFGAQVQRGPLLIAISTQGLFPGLARAVRLWIEDLLPANIGSDIEELATLRRSARQVLPEASQRMAALKNQLTTWLDQTRTRQRPSNLEVT